MLWIEEDENQPLMITVKCESRVRAENYHNMVVLERVHFLRYFIAKQAPSFEIHFSKLRKKWICIVFVDEFSSMLPTDTEIQKLQWCS